jgi:hypothetical protein
VGSGRTDQVLALIPRRIIELEELDDCFIVPLGRYIWSTRELNDKAPMDTYVNLLYIISSQSNMSFATV